MPITTAVKNAMLATLTVTKVSVHHGDPGENGTANELAVPRADCSFTTPADGKIMLVNQVTMPIPAMGIVRYIGYWNGSTFLLSKETPEMQFAAAANFNLLATTTYIDIG